MYKNAASHQPSVCRHFPAKALDIFCDSSFTVLNLDLDVHDKTSMQMNWTILYTEDLLTEDLLEGT